VKIMEAGKSAPIAIQREYHGVSSQITGPKNRFTIPPPNICIVVSLHIHTSKKLEKLGMRS
jgi:hypothetical protein